jgi:hypothetical protein
MSAFETKQQARGRWRRWVGRLLLAGFTILGIAAIIGATYEFVSDRRDARRLPQEGRSVEVLLGKHSLHRQRRSGRHPRQWFGAPRHGMGSSAA